jgi:hypothetical protein
VTIDQLGVYERLDAQRRQMASEGRRPQRREDSRLPYAGLSDERQRPCRDGRAHQHRRHGQPRRSDAVRP